MCRRNACRTLVTEKLTINMSLRNRHLNTNLVYVNLEKVLYQIKLIWQERKNVCEPRAVVCVQVVHDTMYVKNNMILRIVLS